MACLRGLLYVEHFMTKESPVLLLHPTDNVVVCRRTVRLGETVRIPGVNFVVAADVELGHKLARTALLPGEKVIKYGMPIGSITSPVAAGQWVHVHNMKSDYMDAHSREATGENA
jgi:(2R)-sulfolactate sulfo-lyase subunit alpha